MRRFHVLALLALAIASLAGCGLVGARRRPHPAPARLGVPDAGPVTTWRDGPEVSSSTLWDERESEAVCLDGEVPVGIDCKSATPRFAPFGSSLTRTGAVCRWRNEADLLPGTNGSAETTAELRAHARVACQR